MCPNKKTICPNFRCFNQNPAFYGYELDNYHIFKRQKFNKLLTLKELFGEFAFSISINPRTKAMSSVEFDESDRFNTRLDELAVPSGRVVPLRFRS